MDRSLSSFHELLLDKGVAFVRYKLPDQESVTLVSFSPKHFDSLEFLKDEDLEGFVFAPFKADALHPIWFLSGDEIIKEGCNIEALINRVSEMPSSTIKSTSRSSSTTKLDYSKAFEKFRSEIIKEKLDKAILSKLAVEDRGEASLIHLFSELSSTYSKAFTYFIHLPNGESWMGASPELLLQQDKISMRTMALAGTQLVENRKIEDISWENKEREEQAYVKKYIHDIYFFLNLNFLNQTKNDTNVDVISLKKSI